MMIKSNNENQPSDDKNMDIDITTLHDTIVKTKYQQNEFLPEWISNCVKVESTMKNRKSVKKIPNICDELKTLLKALKFKKLFPVQYVVIPELIQLWSTVNIFRPQDVCVCAPTGSGKTLAYVVPLVQILLQSQQKPNGPRVLIILPTRDLASQVHTLFQSLCRDLPINCALITGYKNLDKERDDLLERKEEGTVFKADVIVCTPGRLVEHIKNTSGFNLNFLQHLVIDEADRVLEDPKHDWFVTLTRHIGLGKRYKDLQSSFVQSKEVPVMQKILFSATLTRQPHLLEHFDLHWPKMFQFSSQVSSTDGLPVADTFSAPEGLDEFLVVYHKEYSRIIFIVDQILRQKMSHVLCFTNTKESATRLNQLLNEFPGVRSAYLHCEQAPDTRRKLRTGLVEGTLDILVTVDSMGRGMDIAGVRCVIQYEVTTDVSTYVHRVGRTARAGLKGVAYALVAPNQIYHLKKNLAGCGRQVRMHKFATGKSFRYMDQYNTALLKLQQQNTDS